MVSARSQIRLTILGIGFGFGLAGLGIHSRVDVTSKFERQSYFANALNMLENHV